MSRPNKRTTDEILSGLSCNVSEAARVLGVGWTAAKALVDDGKVHSFKVGKSTRVGTESLKAFARGDETPAQAAPVGPVGGNA